MVHIISYFLVIMLHEKFHHLTQLLRQFSNFHDTHITERVSKLVVCGMYTIRALSEEKVFYIHVNNCLAVSASPKRRD